MIQRARPHILLARLVALATATNLADFEQALQVQRAIGDVSAEASTSWNLGLLYEQQGDLPRAAALMQVNVDFKRQIGHADAEKDAERLARVPPWATWAAPTGAWGRRGGRWPSTSSTSPSPAR